MNRQLSSILAGHSLAWKVQLANLCSCTIWVEEMVLRMSDLMNACTCDFLHYQVHPRELYTMILHLNDFSASC